MVRDRLEECEEQADMATAAVIDSIPWLLSVVSHLVLLIVLAVVLSAQSPDPRIVEVELGYAEELDDPLEFHSPLVVEDPDAVEEPLIESINPPPVEAPFVDLRAIDAALDRVMATKEIEAPRDEQKAVPHLHNGRTLPADVTPIRTTTPQGATVLLPAGKLSWADAVVAYSPGRPRARRASNGRFALGRPNYTSRKEEARFTVLGHGGVLVLEFIDNRLVDVPGPDLVIFEVGPAVEPTRVAISDNGERWIEVGVVQGAGSVLDISPFVAKGQQFRYVRLLDGRAGLSNHSRTPGADVDAVGAIGAVPAYDRDNYYRERE